MINFDFTSHFITVLCLMVILVSTLIIKKSSVNSKWVWGLLCNLSKGLQSIFYVTGPAVCEVVLGMPERGRGNGEAKLADGEGGTA